MKKWLSLTCPVCGFRYPLGKFTSTMKPIKYPMQIVTGGGRAKGFRVVEYLPWSTLPSLAETEAWNNLLFLYDRLATAYDLFYETLGLLSPKMKALLQTLEPSYAGAYRNSPFENYADVYNVKASNDISKAYAASLPVDLPEDFEG